MTDVDDAGFRKMTFIPRDVDVVRDEDGVIRMRCRIPVCPRELSLPAYLRRHATRRPDIRWLSQRVLRGGLWRSVSFGEARRAVDSLTQGLIDLRLPPGAALAVLSDNSIENALVTLAAMQAHIPVAPMSTAYALQSSNLSKLREMLATVHTGALFVQSGQAYARVLEALELGGAPVIVGEDARSGHEDVSYSDLVARHPGPDVERLFAGIDPDAPAKLMFTSGSTGSPKAVIQTQRNLIIAIESNLTTFGYTDEGTMVRLDWTPWSHVFGATGLGLALVAGGSLFIDDGRPAGPLFAETIRNLREIAPSCYVNVPAGYAALVEALEGDAVLARNFFSKLQFLGYGAARLPDDIARRMQMLAVEYTGFRVPFTCGYGATETGPGGALVYWPTDRVGFIGLPQCGYELKLVPVNTGRYEVRVRSEAVTPGYYGRPDVTAQAFDEEGFYRMGDAATFLDPVDPLQGLIFAGRLAEEFKLQTGTFVLASSLRVTLIDAAAPLLHEVVVCGEDQPFVAILAWLNVSAARELIGRADATREELNADPQVRGHIAAALATHNERNPGSSTRIRRFHLLDEPPSIDRGELTDKGSINQGAVQRARRSLVDSLFSNRLPENVVEVAETQTAQSSVMSTAGQLSTARSR